MGIAVDEPVVAEVLVVVFVPVLAPPQAVSSKAKVKNNAEVRAAGLFIGEQKKQSVLGEILQYHGCHLRSCIYLMTSLAN